MRPSLQQNRRVLLIDTCNEACGVAIVVDGDVRGARDIEPGSASAQIVDTVRATLAEAELGLSDLDAVGVVAGPGSFTGVRTGLAAAKGLCEAAALRLVGVSRLGVLAQTVCLTDGVAALDAGQGKLYVREIRPGVRVREFLGSIESMRQIAHGRTLVVSESKLVASLAEFRPVFSPLHALDAATEVQMALLEPAGEQGPLEGIDANYLLEQQDCYSPLPAGLLRSQIENER